jgi:small-conductance mechanosensitive channel
MSIHERQALLSFFSSAAIALLYSQRAIEGYPDAAAYSPEVFHFWGMYFVNLIIVSIIAKIIIAIVFAILSSIANAEQEPDFTDERDRLIQLKSMRNSYVIFLVIFVIAIISVAAQYPPAVLFIGLLAAGLTADLASDVSKFIYNRRGV